MCETHAGVEGTRQVVAHRLQPTWGAATGCLQRFAPIAGEWRRSLNPGLVELVDFGVADDALWVIEGHHEAETLRATLTALGQRQAQLMPNEGLTVLMQVLSTLVELHAQGLVHGDVSASTVLLTPSGQVLLTQFGLALAAGSAPGHGPARSEPDAVTPEQLQGGVDATSDVFRVGLMLHELAVGRALFAGPDPLALARDYTTPSAMPAVPAPFVALIAQFLGRSPTARPHSSEALRELEQLVRTFQFATTEAEVARLFARAFPDRRPLGPLLDRPDGHTLELGGGNWLPPPSSRPTWSGVAPSEAPTPPERPPSTEFQPAPYPAARPTSPGQPFASRPSSPRLRVSSGVSPSASPPGDASASGPVALARITTRKVSRSDLEAIRANELPRPSAPVPARPPREGDPRDAHLGDHLQSRGLLTPVQVSEALDYARSTGSTLTDAIITLELLDEDTVVGVMSDLSRTTAISTRRLDSLQPSRETLALLSAEHALELLVVPLALKGQNQMVVALRDPTDEATVEQIKRATGVTSIVGVRASERAIRRTIARCYGTAAGAELPSWVEPSSASAIFSTPSGLRPQPPSVSSGVRVAAAAPARSDDVLLRLLELLLVRFGEQGRAALELLATVLAVGQRLALGAEELGRLRTATAAIAVCNLSEGRAPATPPNSATLARLLGASWTQLEPVVAPLLEGYARPVEDPTAATLAATFAVAAVTGGSRPRPVEAGAALHSLQTRGCFPGPVLEALRRELAEAR